MSFVAAHSDVAIISCHSRKYRFILLMHNRSFCWMIKLENKSTLTTEYGSKLS